MKTYVGTSGYSYKEWKGKWYPEKIANSDMLAFYGSRLPSVEINNTFYRLPKASVLETWSGQVPKDFRFSIKASRRITHIKRLKEADDETNYLMDTLKALGNQLGVVLFQLPPNSKKNTERFETFLKLVPDRVQAVFEFRNETWFDDEIYDLLKAKNAALCVAETDDAEATPMIPTASFGYLRLRRAKYGKRDVTRWIKRIKEQPWEEAYVFFKHEDEAAGPKFAENFLELINV